MTVLEYLPNILAREKTIVGYLIGVLLDELVDRSADLIVKAVMKDHHSPWAHEGQDGSSIAQCALERVIAVNERKRNLPSSLRRNTP